MEKKLRYAFVFVLIGLVSLKSVYVMYLDMEQIKCRSVAKETMTDREALSTITMTFEQYKTNLTADREIKINGLLYDVVKCRRTGDSVCLTVFHDQKEEEIINTIACLFQTTESRILVNSTDHISKHYSNGGSDWKVLPTAPAPYFTPAPLNAGWKTDNRREAYASVQLHIVSPPPRLQA